MRTPHKDGWAGWVAAVLLAVTIAVPAGAQSLTSGALRGTVQTADGTTLRGASVTLETRSGATIAHLESGFGGDFQLGLLPAGEYRLLVELLGYQPVRVVGLRVSAGATTVLTVSIERRPPPIAAVQEVPASAAQVGTISGRLVSHGELDRLDRFQAASDALRGVTELVWPTDGRSGFGLSADGLPISMSRVMVDGVYLPVFRHPGLASEPASSIVLPRGAVDEIRVVEAPLDVEWRGANGAIFAVQTRRGTDRLEFTPYLMGNSAKLGGRALDNPFDSAATSFQLGATLSGPIVKDTAHFLLHVDYESRLTPTGFPWERDTAGYQGQTVPLAATLSAVAQDSFAANLGRETTTAVRSWKGASGFGKLDWALSATQRLDAHFGFAAWKERTPQLGEGLSLATGSALEGRDVTGALGITSVGATFSNELRAGLSTGRRTWTAAPLPETSLVTEGIAFGGSAALPAFLDARSLDLSDALQLNLEPHQIKIGASVTNTSYQYDYRYGSAGIFQFGTLDRFGQADGAFYQAVGSGAARFATNDIGVFVQDSWHAAPDVVLVAGLRYDVSPVPKNRISLAQGWSAATGVRNDSLKTYAGGVAPRIGFVWDVRNQGQWVMRGGLGLHYGGIDPAAFGEAMLYDGGVTVRRGLGTFPAWPGLPDQALAPDIGPALTILNSSWRPPRTFKAEYALTRVAAGGLTINVAGSYHHTDFLLTRTDLNRVVDPVGTTQEGRPVYGRLQQAGGFVAAVPGSNRRFSDFDLVSGLSPTGYSDYYELTASVERRMSDAFSLIASYTYSKTTDNLVGARSLDPANQLSPFPNGLDGADWTKGPSDFDVPHRLAATALFRSRGRAPITLAGRYRIRSGLPFTPGFQAGVDVNADGAGGNDPAFLGTAIPGLSEALAAGGCTAALGNQFAPRNSCREKMQQALDLHLSIGLPIASTGGRLLLQVDAFNVVGTTTGVIDRAALLIDPAGTVVTDGAGNVTLPLVANPRFGTLLARRGEPRVVRVGFRMEY